MHTGQEGSILAAEYLKRNGVELACIFDEGGNIIDNESGVRAEVALAEKAPNEFVLYKDGDGGHASRPGKEQCLAILQGPPQLSKNIRCPTV